MGLNLQRSIIKQSSWTTNSLGIRNEHWNHIGLHMIVKLLVDQDVGGGNSQQCSVSHVVVVGWAPAYSFCWDKQRAATWSGRHGNQLVVGILAARLAQWDSPQSCQKLFIDLDGIYRLRRCL